MKIKTIFSYLNSQKLWENNNTFIDVSNINHDEIDYIIGDIDINKSWDTDFNNILDIKNGINRKIKIILISITISKKKDNLNLLKKNAETNDNCFVIYSCDYIAENHYNSPQWYLKIRNAIADKIIDIESTNIVYEMNHKGIMNFKLYKLLNPDELTSLKNLNKVLTNMETNVKNNKIDKSKYGGNDYMYRLCNYLNEPWNLNNPIYNDFFKVTLSEIITKTAKKYLEADIYINNALVAVNYNCKDTRTQSQNWHRDPGGKRLIKFFIFFDSVNEANGAFEYIPNSQYTSLSPITTIYRNNGESIYPDLNNKEMQKLEKYNKLINLSDKYNCTGVDTSGFHRAGICQKNKYRKYLHVLFLTKQNILSSKDPGDKYINGFNKASCYNINYNDLPQKWRNYFYKKE